MPGISPGSTAGASAARLVVTKEDEKRFELNVNRHDSMPMTHPRDLVHSADGLHVVIRITDAGDVRLLHCSAAALREADLPAEAQQQHFRLVEVQAAGWDWRAHHGSKYVGTSPARLMTLRAVRELRTDLGPKWEIEQAHDGVVAISHLQFLAGLPALRAWTTVRNESSAPVTLQYVSSFVLMGLAKGGMGTAEDRLRLLMGHNAWYGEAQFRSHTLSELGLRPVGGFCSRRAAFTSQGTWSTSTLLPMGVVSDRETGTSLGFQIEHNGSWHAELGDQVERQHYLAVGGPNEREGLWWRTLAPGEHFDAVPVGVVAAAGDDQAALRELTRYRRRIMRPCDDLRQLPVIFNDYMNCLVGDPTTAKLLPLIDAAATAGCEIFCIDCGWYSDGPWWDGVGEWLPAAGRFPNGIEEPLRRIRERGMVPGLWLELEVMGTQCPLATKVGDDWFFTRHGRRVIDHGRYQLDYRNPAVRAHADAVIDRLVRDYGVGYIKMDYNINAGPGTDHAAEAPGDGLLGHNRAYLAWLDAVFARHPALVIENCGSGGMRLDYALLARHSVQSTTDQTDWRIMPAIAAAIIGACTPEQAATWSYPLRDGDEDEVVVNMVNAMTMRIHQSGHLAELSPARLALVREALDAYKGYRHLIPTALPLWPLGLPHQGDGWMAFGLEHPERTLLAVWRLDGGEASCALPLTGRRGSALRASVVYPRDRGTRVAWQADSGQLVVALPRRFTACLISLEHA
jgi:alpha-galactosidase